MTETGADFELGIPNLQLGELIATGGFGRVYRGYDTFLRRPLAIKILRTATGFEVRSLFEAEAAAHGPLSRHPNIVTLHHAGFTANGGEPYLVMDYIEGGSLAEYLAQSGPLPWQHVVAWMIPICSAVQHVHDHGILHRDIKPDNILLDPPSTPLLSDLGIACLQADTSPFPALSLAHVAPEALRGESPGQPSDVYSLGSTMYQLLTGRLPFGGDLQSRLANVQADPPTVPAELFVPPWLTDALTACLISDPADRLQTPGHLEDLLRRAASQLDLRSPTIPTRAISFPAPAPVERPIEPLAAVPATADLAGPPAGPPSPPVRPVNDAPLGPASADPGPESAATISSASPDGPAASPDGPDDSPAGPAVDEPVPPSALAVRVLPGLRPTARRGRRRTLVVVVAAALALVAVAGAVLAWPRGASDDTAADQGNSASVSGAGTNRASDGGADAERASDTASAGVANVGGDSVPGSPASPSVTGGTGPASTPGGTGGSGGGAPVDGAPASTSSTVSTGGGSPKTVGTEPPVDNGAGGNLTGGGGGGEVVSPAACTAAVVPTVVNLSVADARKALEGAGFRTTQGSAQDSYLAQSTEPAARASACRGDTVRIDACAGTRVPAVGQKSEQDARLAMSGASLAVSVSYADSATVGAGLVVSTSPAAHTPLCVSSKVTITVSNGPPTCFVVPNVVGMTLEQARSTLQAASPYIYVLADYGYTAKPAGGEIGAVFFQSPAGGTKVTTCDYTSVGVTVRAGYIPGT